MPSPIGQVNRVLVIGMQRILNVYKSNVRPGNGLSSARRYVGPREPAAGRDGGWSRVWTAACEHARRWIVPISVQSQHPFQGMAGSHDAGLTGLRGEDEYAAALARE
ncbi:hypothetical protein Axi01nite_47190 [Actinoplanes xinjiangensis]|nr:hypothetical protein Axi01nite_47190 [Actinoplanes xinjiangensis]